MIPCVAGGGGPAPGPDRSHDRMLLRMKRARLTVSVDLRVATAVVGRWHVEHPDQAEIDEDERVAVAAQLGECA